MTQGWRFESGQGARIGLEPDEIRGRKLIPTDGRLVGQTSFLRFPRFQRQLIDYFKRLPPQDGLDILVAPGSIGCEAATLAMLAAEAKLDSVHGRVTVHSVDLSDRFTAIARKGRYPASAVQDLPPPLTKYFNLTAGRRDADIRPDIMRSVNILPAQDITCMKADKTYDAVLSLMFFLWLDRDENRRALRSLKALSRNLVCMNFNDIRRLGRAYDMLDENWKPVALEPGVKPLTETSLRDNVSVFRKKDAPAP